MSRPLQLEVLGPLVGRPLIPIEARRRPTTGKVTVRLRGNIAALFKIFLHLEINVVWNYPLT
jgi:hypothetical protein